MIESNSSSLDFDDLAPREVDIKVGGVVKYILREASDDTVNKYQLQSQKGLRLEDGKVVAIATEARTEAETAVVAACLHPVDEKTGKAQVNGNGNVISVPVSLVKGWPRRVKESLYEKLKEITPALNPKPTTLETVDERIAELKELRDKLVKKQEEQDVKNASSAGTDGSA